MSRRHRAFIQSLEHSRSWRIFDSKDSWKGWAFKFENMGAAEVNPQVFVALAESGRRSFGPCGRTLHEAHFFVSLAENREKV